MVPVPYLSLEFRVQLIGLELASYWVGKGGVESLGGAPMGIRGWGLSLWLPFGSVGRKETGNIYIFLKIKSMVYITNRQA